MAGGRADNKRKRRRGKGLRRAENHENENGGAACGGLKKIRRGQKKNGEMKQRSEAPKNERRRASGQDYGKKPEKEAGRDKNPAAGAKPSGEI